MSASTTVTSERDDDWLARQRAIDTRRSIILQAPAGSGKTTLLTQRFLALLATVDKPEAILAMTFTRKAAAEMRSRVLSALVGAEQGVEPEDDAARVTHQLALAAAAHARAAGWHLQDHPARLRIVTIDGLNRAIVGALPVLSEGVGGLEIAARPERLYREAARRTLQDAEDDEALQPHSARVFARLDNRWDRLESLLARMLATRSQWLRPIVRDDPGALLARIESTLAGVVRETLADASGCIGIELREQAVSLGRYAARELGLSGKDPRLQRAGECLARGVPFDADERALEWWQALADFALTRTQPALRRSVTIATGFPSHSTAEKARKIEMQTWLDSLGQARGAEETLVRVAQLPPLRFAPADTQMLESLVRLLTYAAAQLVLHGRHSGEVDYVAVAAAAREAIREPSESSLGLLHQGAHLQHLLIDEFQDTSTDQFELVAALTTDWSPNDGRTLFLVGDPMQSIYQFREADVGLFTRARDHGIGRLRLESLALSRNFRSQASIVEFVNEVFGRIFPRHDDSRRSAVRYLPCRAATTQSPRLAVTVSTHLFTASGDPMLDTLAEAREVARLVAEARRANAEARVAVLVSARHHATRIVERLRELGLSVQGVDLVPLAETPVVQDLVALNRALRSSVDRIAWLAILRAPWCGLALPELTTLVASDTQRSIAEVIRDPHCLEHLDVHTRERVRRLSDAFSAVGRLTHRSHAQRLEQLWLMLGGPTVYAEAGVVQDARRYFDALASTRDADDVLEGLYSASDAPSPDAVQVMTVHRAKGLEFDCVILPGLARRGRSDETELLDWIEWAAPDGSDALLMAPIRAPQDKDPSSLSRWIRSLRAARADHERSRVWYVACTRARCALHLLATLPVESPGEVKDPAGDTPLGLLWPALRQRFVSALKTSASVTDRAPSSGPLSRRLQRVSSDWVPPEWPLDVVFESLPVLSGELAPETVEGEGEGGRIDPSMRPFGIVLHRELERLARMPSLPSASEIVAQTTRLRAALQAEGVEQKDLSLAVDRLRSALERTLGDVRGRWILQRRERDDRIEWPLTGRHDGRWVSIVIDRAFIDDDGQRWIIDYKSSFPDGGDLESFLRAKRIQYAPQLRRYARFVERLDGGPARTALYFPMIATFVDLTDELDEGSPASPVL